MIKHYTVAITRMVSVEIDEKKVTKDAIETFSATMWKIEGIEEIVRHIAYIVGQYDLLIRGDSLIEGLGKAEDFGVKALIEDESTEVDSLPLMQMREGE